jgi:integrase
MRGHIAKREGRRGVSWAYVVDLPKKTDGRRRQKWVSGFRTRREAQEALAEELGRLRSGTFVESSRITLAEYLEGTWLPAMRSQLRPGTWDAYRWSLGVYVIPHLGQVRLQKLTPGHLSTLYADLLAHGGKGGRPLSGRSVQYAGSILRKALNDAVRKWDLLEHNPSARADLPKRNRTAMATWTGPELERFLAQVKGDRLAALWTFAALSGARRGEVVGLRWADLDLEAGTASIRQAIVMVARRPTFQGPKTGRGRRLIRLDAATVAALRAHRKAQAEERLAWGAAWTDHGLVFCQEDGQPLNPETVAKWFQAHSRAAGLPRIRFHDLRHTWATLALQAGVHPKAVSGRLGHATIAITLDTYSHLLPDVESDAAERVAGLVLGSGG